MFENVKIDKRDRLKTREWALASVGSAGYKLNVAYFELLNRVTGRAHALVFAGVGLDTPLGSASAAPPSYVMFETPKPVSFFDFDISIAELATGGGVIYGLSTLKIYKWDLSIHFRGFGVFMPHLAVYEGTLNLWTTAGTPSARNINLAPNVRVPSSRERPMTRVRTPGHEPKLIVPKPIDFSGFGRMGTSERM